jgi:hypothetical protein
VLASIGLVLDWSIISSLFRARIANYGAGVWASECVIEIFHGEVTAGALAGVDRVVVLMDLFANGEPLEEELDQEGTTAGSKSSDKLGMAIPIYLREDFFRNFPIRIWRRGLLGMIRFSMTK